MQEKTLAKVKDANLRVYVVWTPMLAPDFQFTIRRATTRVPDPRASHFWDRDGQLAKEYARVLQLGQGMKAWDVYFVFGRDAQWTDAPPTPYYWMDKLGLDPERELDGDKLAVEVNKLVEGTR